jgi:hypothetical protein
MLRETLCDRVKDVQCAWRRALLRRLHAAALARLLTATAIAAGGMTRWKLERRGQLVDGSDFRFNLRFRREQVEGRWALRVAAAACDVTFEKQSYWFENSRADTEKKRVETAHIDWSFKPATRTGIGTGTQRVPLCPAGHKTSLIFQKLFISPCKGGDRSAERSQAVREGLDTHGLLRAGNHLPLASGKRRVDLR